MLITISRQFGAGGSAVAARVAATLGWRVVDNELVERVAARAGLTPGGRGPAGGAGLHVHRAPGSRGGRRDPGAGGATGCRRTAASLAEADLVRLTERVVEEVAAEGRVVLVGRAAPAVLARERDAIHVKVVAPRAWRIRTVVERLGVSAEEAAGLIDETDRNRARYHRQHYHRDWADPANYHLVLNTAALGLDGAAEVIVGRARALGWV